MVGKVFRVIFTRKAQRRLDQITDYHYENSSPATARKVRRRLIQAAKELEHLPESKPILPGTDEFDPKVRYNKRWSYKLIFSVFKKKSEVSVITIRHDKEDTKRIIDDL